MTTRLFERGHVNSCIVAAAEERLALASVGVAV